MSGATDYSANYLIEITTALTTEEKFIFDLYNLGTRAATTGLLREALFDVYDPSVRDSINSLISKLAQMSELEIYAHFKGVAIYGK